MRGRNLKLEPGKDTLLKARQDAVGLRREISEALASQGEAKLAAEIDAYVTTLL